MPSHLIGLISDTHGLVRPSVHDALKGVELILHAGDVGGGAVLDELAVVAPILAVAGNVDDPWNPVLHRELVRQIGPISIHVSHGNELGHPTPARLAERYDADVIVFGHTHRALVERLGSRLVVNPGAAGPRRFRLVPSVARLSIHGTRVDVEIVELAV